MHRPTALRLFRLFARTALQRFLNRFAYLREKRKAAKRRRAAPVDSASVPPDPAQPVRTGTVHRNQRFRMGNLLGGLFMIYMLFAFVMMVKMSLERSMFGIMRERQPAELKFVGRHLPPPGAERLPDSGRNRDREREGIGENAVPYMNAETRRAADRVAGLLMAAFGIGTLLFAIGMLSRQISRPEPSLAWLFEFPVPRPVLFSSKLFECLFDGASLPLLSMVPGLYLSMCGYGAWACIGWGLAFGIVAALAIGALRISLEVLLLQKCARRRRGTIGGLCAAMGTLLMVVVLYGGGTPALLRGLLTVATALPDWMFSSPLSGGFGFGPVNPGGQFLPCVTGMVVLCTGAVFFCAALTRYGLEPGLETARGAAPLQSRPLRPSRISGLVAKELYMLVRQRAVLVQVLLAPLVMVLMLYFQSSGRFAERAMGNPGAMAATIYGICAYMVLIAAQVAMNTELRTLWLMLSLPRPLADSLRVKSRIWGLAAGSLALVLGLVAIVTHPHMTGELLYRLPFIVLFVGLVADLSVGIRTVGSSIISESTVHFRQWAQWMPLLLSASAGQAVLSGSVWALCVQAVLLGALDVSVWQKLNADLPYLTEPAEDPPPRLFLMHGLLAAYGYFALQTFGLQIAITSRVPLEKALPWASAAAAVVVAGLACWHLARRGVRILPVRAASWAGTAVSAVAALGAACAIGWAWLRILPQFEWSRVMVELSRAALQGSGDAFYSIAALSVIVAPLCEEFIFRGLVYHGLRRTRSFAASLLWSSLFFTAVHPPASSVAVFGLAALNAWLMERTGRLTPCILVHAGYNAFVIWLQMRS